MFKKSKLKFYKFSKITLESFMIFLIQIFYFKIVYKIKEKY